MARCETVAESTLALEVGPIPRDTSDAVLTICVFYFRAPVIGLRRVPANAPSSPSFALITR